MTLDLKFILHLSKQLILPVVIVIIVQCYMDHIVRIYIILSVLRLLFLFRPLS